MQHIGKVSSYLLFEYNVIMHDTFTSSIQDISDIFQACLQIQIIKCYVMKSQIQRSPKCLELRVSRLMIRLYFNMFQSVVIRIRYQRDK
jgi:hypothetical protein